MGNAIGHHATRRASSSSLVPVPGDEELVRRVRAGDEGAFEALYRRHRDPIYRYCYSILRQREDAEEALQATMLAAYRALTGGDRRELALRPWLYRIAHNTCINAVERRSLRQAVPLSGAEPAPGGVEQHSELSARLRELRRDLDQLEERPRAALLMRELGGLSHVEIGQVLGEPPAVVKQLVYQARVALHDMAAGRDLACDSVRRTISDGDGRLLRARALRSHLRACAGCRGFRESLRARPALLTALVPALSPDAGREILAVVLGSGGAGGAGLGAGAAGGGLAVAGLGLGTAASGGAGTLVAKIAVVGSLSLLGGAGALVSTFDSPPPAPARSGAGPSTAGAPRLPAALVPTGAPEARQAPARARPVARRSPVAGPERPARPAHRALRPVFLGPPAPPSPAPARPDPAERPHEAHPKAVEKAHPKAARRHGLKTKREAAPKRARLKPSRPEPAAAAGAAGRGRDPQGPPVTPPEPGPPEPPGQAVRP